MISIIIPTKNEANVIHETIRNLQDLRKNKICEIIIVDGKSDDETVKLANPYVDKVLLSEPNRGLQQNIGARAASGDTLMFLHADTHIDVNHIEFLINIKDYDWGFFKISFDKTSLKYKLLSFCINLRSSLFKYGTGDQVFFIKKNIFDRIDGFPKYELMEDIKLCSNLKKVSKPLISKIYIKTSARKWEKNGFLWTIIKMRLLRFLYFLKVNPSKLNSYYK